MAAAIANSKRQITIPSHIRTSLGLQSRDKVEYVELEKRHFAIRADKQSVKYLKGMIRKPESALSIEH
jgi:bifunctional DNA-binding transcriptional regulator/antitoxin component of YhaV-PrlF toxin-antitoxin module